MKSTQLKSLNSVKILFGGCGSRSIGSCFCVCGGKCRGHCEKYLCLGLYESVVILLGGSLFLKKCFNLVVILLVLVFVVVVVVVGEIKSFAIMTCYYIVNAS